MKDYNLLAFEARFEELETLLIKNLLSLDDLNEEAFEIFKNWIEKAPEDKTVDVY